MKFVSWFSCGVSSAVATKIALNNNKCDSIIYIDIKDHHQDNERFLKECEKWFKMPIEIIKSSKFASVNDVLKLGYINGVGGASCTKKLKKDVRKLWEKENLKNDTVYVWGLDSTERHRVERIDLATECKNYYPLIENNITKEQAHGMIKEAEIKRPFMYDLGYNNNNCIGCVKGGKGYWNKIRKDFPNVFKERIKAERKAGHSCIKGIFLDELKENEGNINEVIEDCGIFCEIKDYTETTQTKEGGE